MDGAGIEARGPGQLLSLADKNLSARVELPGRGEEERRPDRDRGRDVEGRGPGIHLSYEQGCLPFSFKSLELLLCSLNS